VEPASRVPPKLFLVFFLVLLKTAYADEWALGAGFDLQRLLGWNGAHFQITITDRNGRELDQTANLHTLQQVQAIPAERRPPASFNRFYATPNPYASRRDRSCRS